MAQADFYLLSNTDASARDLFMCRLCERALKAKTTLAIFTNSEAHARTLDPLLWQYQPASFLPHRLANSHAEIEAPIIVFWEGTEVPEHGALLNMADELPQCVSQFERLLEIVPNNEAAKVTARARYKALKTQSWALNMHNIS